MTIDPTSTRMKRAAKAGSTTKGLTKKDQLIRMLSSKTGSEVGTISARLGWQAHTTRAALSGLRNAGYEIAAEKAGKDKTTRYRIMAHRKAVTADAKAESMEVGDAVKVSEVCDAG